MSQLGLNGACRDAAGGVLKSSVEALEVVDRILDLIGGHS